MVFVINMRVFKTIFILLIAFTSLVQAGPASFLRLEHRTDDDSLSLPMDNLEFSTTNSSSTILPLQDTYDQRQNGTENYQIHASRQTCQLPYTIPTKNFTALNLP
ncbi:hypothetical protein G9C98_004832 [Cotesia typhae]|uniref:Uncharacterized protein n=1 Tax=Cotesia typhae TaxID=2053667 RepID=A0A8J5QUN5_9HYME|nr:hypothetical protein G9C98_004832 [Cotesia typhae]